MSIREEQFAVWAKPPSDTENTMCLNAVSLVTDAIREKFGESVEIFTQGSHRNRTNIKLDSDVDVVVRHKAFHLNAKNDFSEEDTRRYNSEYFDADYTYATFKNEVESALRAFFDYDEVDRRPKCIRIKGNTYRVHADVVPAFTHHRFYGKPYRKDAEGIKFITDTGDHVVSYPNQHYERGKEKHENTGRRYKKAVRILKNLRNKLIEDGKIGEDLVSSFFIESLVSNQPKNLFEEETLKEMMKSITLQIMADMKNSDRAENYTEVSDLHYMFRGPFKRTPEDAYSFADKAFFEII